MSDPGYSAQLDAAKRRSVSQLLFKCARLLNEQALARVREETGLPIRPAHSTLFPHLDLEGTRITELARRLGVSKQAVGQLVDELEAMGAVERRPDPQDGRARRVYFTERGRQGLLHGLSLLGRVEAELAQELGVQRMEELHDTLLRLEQLLARSV